MCCFLNSPFVHPLRHGNRPRFLAAHLQWCRHIICWSRTDHLHNLPVSHHSLQRHRPLDLRPQRWGHHTGWPTVYRWIHLRSCCRPCDSYAQLDNTKYVALNFADFLSVKHIVDFTIIIIIISLKKRSAFHTWKASQSASNIIAPGHLALHVIHSLNHLHVSSLGSIQPVQQIYATR